MSTASRKSDSFDHRVSTQEDREVYDLALGCRFTLFHANKCALMTLERRCVKLKQTVATRCRGGGPLICAVAWCEVEHARAAHSQSLLSKVAMKVMIARRKAIDVDCRYR
jgi:hypothetical protein